MKKLFLLSIVLMLALITGCQKKDPQELPGDAGKLCLVKVETDGIGLVAIAMEGQELEFDEEMTSSSAYMNVPEGTILTIGAKDSVYDFKFSKWTKNGEDFSQEYQFTVTIEEPTDFIAVFGMSTGWDGPTASSIEEVKTLGDILGLPSYGYSVYEDAIVYGFELNGVIYRAIADMTPEVSAQVNDAFGDNQKFYGLIAPLEVKLIENVSESIPAQEELDKYIGKTGQDLLDEGWNWTYYNLDELECGMEHGWYTYVVKFEGTVENKADVDVETAIKDLKVVSVTYEGISSSLTDLAE